MNILIMILKFLLKILMIVGGTAFYVKGETDTKLLGKTKKEWKYAMGIPIAFFGTLAHWSFIPLLALVTYFIACEIGYGDNNLLTKLVGKRWAIIIHGTAVGLASFPLIGFWAIPAAIISGAGFDFIRIQDDIGKIKEPFVAIARGVAGTIFLLI